MINLNFNRMGYYGRTTGTMVNGGIQEYYHFLILEYNL